MATAKSTKQARSLFPFVDADERSTNGRRSAKAHFVTSPPTPLGRADHYTDLMKPAPTEQPARAVLNKVGMRCGRLVVVAPAPARLKSGKWVTYWRCRCECGNERDIMGQRLGGGRRSTLSCGCLRLDVIASKDPVGGLFGQYKKNLYRQRQTVGITLSRGEFERLIFGACHYCGRQPHLEIKHSRGLRRNTIDRVDPFGDYAASNCVSSCWPCNRMKRTYTAADFLSHVRRIVAFQDGIQ